YGLARTPRGKKIYSASLALADPVLPGPGTRISAPGDRPAVFEHSLSPENAAFLRTRFPFLAPSVLGLRSSAGFGDRLGCATPGH
ncbi:hypothetical protein EO238_29985, partial [Citrobacter sp. AAK_AS5]